MDNINIYLSLLVERKELSYPASQIFLDYAYDLALNGYSDLEIENIIITDINHTLER